MTYSDFDDELDLAQEERPQRPSLEETLNALASHETGTSATIFYGLSGLSSDDLAQIGPIWESLAPARRRRIMREMVDVAEANFELDYGSIGRLGLTDADPSVREAAIDLLWEDDSPDMMRNLIRIATQDPSVEVRASAMSALGRFILKGELGELPETAIQPAQDTAIRALNDTHEDVDVRRRALEAISNSSHPIVEGAIAKPTPAMTVALRSAPCLRWAALTILSGVSTSSRNLKVPTPSCGMRRRARQGN